MTTFKLGNQRITKSVNHENSYIICYPENDVDELEKGIDRHLDCHYEVVKDHDYTTEDGTTYPSFVDLLFDQLQINYEDWIFDMPALFLTSSDKPDDLTRNSSTRRTQEGCIDVEQLLLTLYRRPYVHNLVRCDTDITDWNVDMILDASRKIIKMKDLPYEKIRTGPYVVHERSE